jgi:sugar/nucleoside kinase (ribokinase family)
MYAAQCSGLIIHTYGSAPILFGKSDEKSGHFHPFHVNVKDTTGAGDSFRAGIIYGLLQGQQDTELLRTASAQ